MEAIRFFDDSQIVGWVNVTRHIHRPRKHPANPVMSKSAPWEDTGLGWHWPSVLFDDEDGLFKAWYECLIDGHGFGAYAVSGDGLHWERPELGLIAWNGSKKNNLFYHGTNSDHAGGTVTGNPRCSNLSLAIGDADRIVSVRAGAKTGSVLVGPVKVAGSHLVINANARRGEMRVLLRDPDTRSELKGWGVKQGDVVSSDSKRHVITWDGRSDLRSLRGRRVLVQVYLMRADLFSIGWGA